MDLLKSEGLKRKLASALAVVLEVAKQSHFLVFLVPYVNHTAQLFGIAGLVHATVEKNFAGKVLISTSSFLTALTLLAVYEPALQPLIPLVAKLAALFGAAGIGATLK